MEWQKALLIIGSILFGGGVGMLYPKGVFYAVMLMVIGFVLQALSDYFDKRDDEIKDIQVRVPK